MKKLVSLTLGLVIFALAGTIAQSVVPTGMRYQAIARDIDGNIKSNQDLTVKVELIAFGVVEEVVYAELHDVTSGQFGLLNMTIGEGLNISGTFDEVPWSRQNLWVRVGIKGNDREDFQIVTTSKFYSVPYAFYARTAGKLAEDSDSNTSNGDNTRTPGLGMNSINWTLEGNLDAQNRNDGNPVLGTVDENDLVVVTNNETRLTIDVAGDATFTGDVDVDGNLNADQDVVLNTESGSTTIHGDLTVENMSSTHLTGTLQVDKALTLGDTLTITGMSPTHLTGSLDVDKTLNVDGATTLNNSLDVTGGHSTNLSGTLDVGMETNIGGALTVENMSSTHLTGTLDLDKALNVDGATTLNNSLDVTGMSSTHLSGTLTVDKETTFGAAFTVENMAPTHLTGSLTTDETMNVDGATTLNGALDVAGMSPTHLTGTLEVDKQVTMNDGLSVSSPGTLGPNGEHVAFFDNTDGGSGDGIGIQIQKESTTKANNFVTFYRGDDQVAGRIEGYVLSDIGTPPLPTSDEIWTAVCIAVADYNPVTLMWTSFASRFNLFGTIWNGATIPAFEIPDFPGLVIPDFPGQTLPDFPGLVLPDFPGLVLPNFPGVVIPDIDPISIPDVGQIFPGLPLPNIPGFNVPDIPSFNVPDVPSFNVPDIPAFVIPDIPSFVIPDVPEIDLSADLFEIPVIPTFSDILMDLGVCPDEDIFAVPDGYVYRLIEWGVQNDMQNMISFNPVDLAAKALTWGVTKVVKVGGVTYGAKGADYAEYLPKVYSDERLLKAEIVGVHGGQISKITKGADQILAISTNPLVLGNVPEDENKSDFEKVGFLGQVPVYVRGPIEVGDYVIPSGKNDGIGKAIKPQELSADILPQILGKAWSSSSLEVVAVINVSIGLRPTEIAEVLKQREATLLNLQEQINTQNTVHNQLKADVNTLMQHMGIDDQSTKLRSN